MVQGKLFYLPSYIKNVRVFLHKPLCGYYSRRLFKARAPDQTNSFWNHISQTDTKIKTDKKRRNRKIKNIWFYNYYTALCALVLCKYFLHTCCVISQYFNCLILCKPCINYVILSIFCVLFSFQNETIGTSMYYYTACNCTMCNLLLLGKSHFFWK